MLARHWRVGAILVAALALSLIVVAAFPWALARPLLEQRLSARFGRPVTIGRVERLDRFGFSPRLRVSDIRIPQPAWAGKGDFVRIARLDATFPLRSMVGDGLSPRDVEASGVRLALAQREDGANNWGGHEGGTGIDLAALGDVRLTASLISYRDGRGERRVVARFAVDPVAGVRAAGSARLRGMPARVALRGASIRGGAGKPWPFVATIQAEALAMGAVGTMDLPFDTEHMAFDLTARADDLKRIDAVIQAGLFNTQPVDLAAHVRHDPKRWTISRLRGKVGRSTVTGEMRVDKGQARTNVEGEVAFVPFDFDDLASDAGIARARALARRIGPRLVPNTPIDLSRIGPVDGRLAVRLEKVTSGGAPTLIRSATGVLTLDRHVLTVAPMQVRLRSGAATGRIVIDQRDGAPAPLATFGLRLQGAELSRLVGGDITGAVTGRFRLAGRGRTVREAIGQADGTMGLVVRDGVLPERIAYAAGFAPLNALLAGKHEQATLRCGAIRLEVKQGRARASTLIVDTSRSQLRGGGELIFPAERLDFRLTGVPKGRTAGSIAGVARLGGTLSDPSLPVPRELKSVGAILKSATRAVAGRRGPRARDLDCGSLAGTALR